MPTPIMLWTVIHISGCKSEYFLGSHPQLQMSSKQCVDSHPSLDANHIHVWTVIHQSRYKSNQCVDSHPQVQMLVQVFCGQSSTSPDANPSIFWAVIHISACHPQVQMPIDLMCGQSSTSLDVNQLTATFMSMRNSDVQGPASGCGPS
jgi:hypothetical protein